MKVWGTALLLGLAACAAPSRSAPPPAAAPEAKGFVDALRVDREYRPAPQGSESVSMFYEFPPGAYIAQGWSYDCWPVYLSRSADCRRDQSFSGDRSSPCATYRPYRTLRPCAY